MSDQALTVDTQDFFRAQCGQIEFADVAAQTFLIFEITMMVVLLSVFIAPYRRIDGAP